MRRLLLVCCASLALAGCGQSVVTRPRLERSIQRSFANRYVAQAKLLGHHGVSVASLHTRAFCDKGGPTLPDRGPGSDWNCYLSFNDPNVPLPDGTGKFEMNVHANGCYTAGGSSKVVGLLTLTSVLGRTVANPVAEWDACFDPTGSDTPQPGEGPPATVSLPTGKVPISDGVVEPELSCSAGARGGCIGTLTASIHGRTVATVNYQLAPKEANGFSFPVAGGDRRLGTPMTLTVAPFLGKVAAPTSRVTLGPAAP